MSTYYFQIFTGWSLLLSLICNDELSKFFNLPLTIDCFIVSGYLPAQYLRSQEKLNSCEMDNLNLKSFFSHAKIELNDSFVWEQHHGSKPGNGMHENNNAMLRGTVQCAVVEFRWEIRVFNFKFGVNKFWRVLSIRVYQYLHVYIQLVWLSRFVCTVHTVHNKLCTTTYSTANVYAKFCTIIQVVAGNTERVQLQMQKETVSLLRSYICLIFYLTGIM